MKTIFAIITAAGLVVMNPSLGHAQLLCFRQGDMAGQYVTEDGLLGANIEACGITSLVWVSADGRIVDSKYRSDARLPHGGVVAHYTGFIGPPLDGAPLLIVKPGTAGYIEVGTFANPSTLLNVYTLRKRT